MRCPLLVLIALAAPALADEPKHPLPDYFAALVSGTYPGGGDPEGTPPRFAFTYSASLISPKDLSDTTSALSAWGGPDVPVVGKSGDGKATWIATDVSYGFACGMEGCDKMVMPVVHAAGLFDSTNHAVAWSVGLVEAGRDDRRKPVTRIKPVTPPALATGIDAGAEPAVAVFKASLADPDALAKTFSDRKDAALYGSEAPERYIGGAAAKATLHKWRLGFTLRDGIQAGVVPSKTTAWVAANVDAAKKGDKKATPYRVFAIYDKHGADWQLVVLHFSIVTASR